MKIILPILFALCLLLSGCTGPDRAAVQKPEVGGQMSDGGGQMPDGGGQMPDGGSQTSDLGPLASVMPPLPVVQRRTETRLSVVAGPPPSVTRTNRIIVSVDPASCSADMDGLVLEWGTDGQFDHHADLGRGNITGLDFITTNRNTIRYEFRFYYYVTVGNKKIDYLTADGWETSYYRVDEEWRSGYSNVTHWPPRPAQVIGVHLSSPGPGFPLVVYVSATLEPTIRFHGTNFIDWQVFTNLTTAGVDIPNAQWKSFFNCAQPLNATKNTVQPD